MTPEGAGECGGGCWRKKAAHTGAGAVAGFFACLLVVWATGGGCGGSGSGGVAETEQVVGQFNLSRSELQALVSLLSSSQVYLLVCSQSDKYNVCCSDLLNIPVIYVYDITELTDVLLYCSSVVTDYSACPEHLLVKETKITSSTT